MAETLRLKQPRASNLSLADVRDRKASAEAAATSYGPAGEARKDTDDAPVRNVPGPASDAVRKRMLAERLAEKDAPMVPTTVKRDQSRLRAPQFGINPVRNIRIGRQRRDEQLERESK